jgi:hypothetical protein
LNAVLESDPRQRQRANLPKQSNNRTILCKMLPIKFIVVPRAG